jgi:hypothetical protein
MRGFALSIGVLCLFNGCMCTCGPQDSAGSCGLGDAGGGGCTFEAGSLAPDVSVTPGDDGGGTDTGQGAEASAVGICNGAICPAGCACDLVDDDAGGGACVCGDAGEGDATTDAESADAADATGADARLDAGDGGGGGDGGVAVDGSGPDAAAGDATVDASEAGQPSPCGVITCGAGCVCVNPGASDCVCP